MVLLGFSGCKNPWDDHGMINKDIVTDNLNELINKTPELSVFAGYLSASGLSDEITTSKTYTVWAPNNAAMELVDKTILNDSVRLRQFVGNHISFTLYSYYNNQPASKIKSLSGKTILPDYQNRKINDANLIDPLEIVAKNGILHIIDKPLIPKPNIWDFIESTNLCPLHTTYLNSLTGTVFDPEKAIQIGVDPITGKAIYDVESGLTWSNPVISKIRDLKSEDSVSTVFLVSDDTFQKEFLKLRPYFTKLNDNKITNDLTYWNVAKDYIFAGDYSLNGSEDTLVSLFNVKVPFNKTEVRSVFEASNGKVFIMNDCSIALKNKILPIIIEGEDTTKIITKSLTGQSGYTRESPLASGGYDFILDNHGANPGSINYHIGEVSSTKYNVYWKAVDDFNYSYRYPNTVDTIKQRMARVQYLGIVDKVPVFSEPAPLTSNFIPVLDASYITAPEIFVGTRTFTSIEDLWLQVTGSGNNTTICLDYIKIVPVFE
jgi:uncharacterized surface protein with fasciclin (FAS1) repeats